MTALYWITEPLELGFMQNALLVTVIASIVCALLSCWLILIGWSLMGEAVAHAVLPGVVLAYVLGLPFAIGALACALITVWLIGALRDSTALREDTTIGIVFSTMFAIGIMLVSVIPSNVDLQHILFGSLLGLSPGDAAQVILIAVATGALLIVKRRDLTLYAFDPSQAHVSGLSIRWLKTLLLVALALTVVVTLQTVGIVLVVAMLIIPGATAFLLCRTHSTMLVVAPALAASASIAGLYTAYYVDASPGGMIVTVQGLLFAAVYLGHPRRGVIPRACRTPGVRTRPRTRPRTGENASVSR